MPKLSVVAIPVRDEAERIGGCLAALARQSVPADHIVLLLNNCTDRTADLVRGLPNFVIPSEAEGPAGAP